MKACINKKVFTNRSVFILDFEYLFFILAFECLFFGLGPGPISCCGPIELGLALTQINYLKIFLQDFCLIKVRTLSSLCIQV